MARDSLEWKKFNMFLIYILFMIQMARNRFTEKIDFVIHFNFCVIAQEMNIEYGPNYKQTMTLINFWMKRIC